MFSFQRRCESIIEVCSLMFWTSAIFSLTFQNPGVQSSASQALAVMSENLSSRDEVGKLGEFQRKCTL